MVNLQITRDPYIRRPKYYPADKYAMWYVRDSDRPKGKKIVFGVATKSECQRYINDKLKETKMELITKGLLKKFKEQGDTSQNEAKDTKVIAKFFNPVGRGTWYACEYYPETDICFGFVSLFGDHNDEAGDFSMTELREAKLPMGLKIERDIHFESGKYSLQDLFDGKRP